MTLIYSRVGGYPIADAMSTHFFAKSGAAAPAIAAVITALCASTV